MRGVYNDPPVTSELALRDTSATQCHINIMCYSNLSPSTPLSLAHFWSREWLCHKDDKDDWALKFWGRRVPVNFNTAGIYAFSWDGLVFEMLLSSQNQTVSEISVSLFHCENGQDIPKLAESPDCCVVWAEKTSCSDTILWVNTLQCCCRSPSFTYSCQVLALVKLTSSLPHRDNNPAWRVRSLCSRWVSKIWLNCWVMWDLHPSTLK